MSNQIRDFCQSYGVIILGEVSYDPDIPLLQSEKLTPVEAGSKSAKEIKTIFEKFFTRITKEV